MNVMTEAATTATKVDTATHSRFPVWPAER